MPKRRRRDQGSGSIYQTATGLWRASFELPTTDGTRRRKVVSANTKAGVIKKRRDIQRELEDHGDIPTTELTITRWATNWLDTNPRQVTPKTLAGYRTEITHRIIPILGKFRLTALTPRHVHRLHDEYTRQGLSGTTASLGHRTLRVLLADAVRAGHITKNVAEAKYVAEPRKTTPEVELPSVEKLVELAQAAAADPVMGARWLTTLFTGMRRGEALGLQLSDVDFDQDVIRLSRQLLRLPVSHGCGGSCGRRRAGDCPQVRVDVPVGYDAVGVQGSLFLVRPKSSAGVRVLPLVDPLRSVLLRHVEGRGEGLLWDVGGSVLTPERDNRLWQGLRESVGLPGWKPHHARHAAATLMLVAGVDVYVVQRVIGHSSVAMTRHYQHVGLGQAREALVALSGLLPLEGAAA